MTQEELKAHIEKRERELKLHRMIMEYIEKLHADVVLSPGTYDELCAKISSKIAFCEISIRDHKKDVT